MRQALTSVTLSLNTLWSNNTPFNVVPENAGNDDPTDVAAFTLLTFRFLGNVAQESSTNEMNSRTTGQGFGRMQER